MSKKELQLEAASYEKERLEYFTFLMIKAQKKYNRLFKKFKDAPVLSAYHEILCIAGTQSHFHADVVEMLEKCHRKQSEGEWILHYDGSGTCTVCNRKQKAVWDDDSFQRYCGCCGVKMKEKE